MKTDKADKINKAEKKLTEETPVKSKKKVLIQRKKK